MPQFTANESILIDASVDQVFETVANFETWNAWSPWLVVDVVDFAKNPCTRGILANPTTKIEAAYENAITVR